MAGKKKKARQQPEEQQNNTTPASFDAELDRLFTGVRPTSNQVIATPSAAPPAPESKRKRTKAEGQFEQESHNKRAKSTPIEAEAAAKEQHQNGLSGSDEEDVSGDDQEEVSEDDASLGMSDIEREIAEQGLIRGEGESEEDLVDDDESQDDEDGSSEDEEDSAMESDDDEMDTKPPTHESLAKSREEKRIRRKLEERELESKEVRDKRSIFLANVPIACIQSKTLTKALKKRIVSLSPYPSITRVEALRYRSVAFAVPTADYAAESGADAASNEKRRARSRAFKEAVDAAGEDGDVSRNGKPYLNAKQKRKVAYINQEINEKARAVNAYITLEKLTDKDLEKLKKLPGSSLEKTGNLTPPILAALTAAKVDDTLFEGRHLRADLATPLTLPELVSAGFDKVLSSPSTSASLTRILTGGMKSKENQSRTLFVGNLDFEADEEDLRATLEAIVTEERGSPPASAAPLGQGIKSLPPFEDVNDGLSEPYHTTWVQSVRMIRDAATQMGKGFGYVTFLDDGCVDELMAIWEADEAFLAAGKPGSRSKDDGKREDGNRREFKRRLKLNKRPLRLSRCKNTGGSGGQKKPGAGSARKPVNANGSGSATEATTPQKKMDNRRRSMGAPTPDGTSPSVSAKKTKVANISTAESPSRPSTARYPSSSSTLIPNPPPKFPRSEAEEARLAIKRNDPDRQAKRMAKKERKRLELKMGSRTGGAKEKVDLKLGKKAKVGKNNSGFKEGPKKGGSTSGGGGRVKAKVKK